VRLSPVPSLSSDEEDFDDMPSQPGPATPSRWNLHQQSLLMTEQWYKSKNTQKGYTSHVWGGKQFVKDWDVEHKEEEDNDGAVPSA
jgi:hypothetical protein